MLLLLDDEGSWPTIPQHRPFGRKLRFVDLSAFVVTVDGDSDAAVASFRMRRVVVPLSAGSGGEFLGLFPSELRRHPPGIAAFVVDDDLHCSVRMRGKKGDIAKVLLK